MKQWIIKTSTELSDNELEQIYNMLKESYKSMSNIIRSVSIKSLRKSENNYLLLNKESEYICFIIFRQKSLGKKIHLLGSQNNIVAKAELMSKLKELLMSGEWFIEGGRKIDEFCIKYNIPYVENIDLISNIIKPSKIDSVLENGYYKRKAAFGAAVKKRLYGVSNMKTKINEIQKSYGDGYQGAADNLAASDVLAAKDLYKIDKYKKVKRVNLKKYKNQIKKADGVRFLFLNYDAAQWWGEETLLMLMPDRDFILGYIVFSPEYIKMADGQLLGVAKVKASATHFKFRRKGLGKKMYKYLLNEYGVIMSDLELYPGSWKMWTETMPRDFGGVLAVYGSGYNYEDEYPELGDEDPDNIPIPISNKKTARDKDLIEAAARFVFFRKASYLYNHGYVYDSKLKVYVPDEKILKK